MNILQMSLSASVMIAAVAVIRALTLHRLPKRTFLALWGAVVCRLLIPCSISSRFSFYTGFERVKQWLLARTDVISPSAAYTAAGIHTAAPAAREAVGGAASVAPASAAPVSPVFVAWLVGMCVSALFFVIAYLKYRREFKTSLPVQNDIAVHWLREHRLRRTVQIRQSDRVQAPLTYGILRPVILLPKTIDWADEAGLKAILTHEFTHVMRFDTLTKLALSAAVCVHWFNPLVWVMYGLANRDIELACDESVVWSLGVNEKSAYAMMLIRLEEKKSGLAPLISGFAGNAVEERITAIMKIKKRSLIGVVLALVLVIGTVTAFATSATDASEENNVVTASDALEQLVDSVCYADGELSFQIPENYPDAKNWNILISGRTEQDGFGMSVHYLTEENESKSWEAGKRYVIPLTGNTENYTQLWITAFLPDENGAADERSADLLAVISFPSPNVTTGPADEAALNGETARLLELLDNGGWVWPAEGCDTVSSRFGKRVHPVSGITTESDHITISGDNAEGAKVYAALAGTVSETGFADDRGNYIRITHAGGIETVYAHLKEVLAEDGASVISGEIIGTVGQTGNATGPCLAFSVYVDGAATNPLDYFHLAPAE